MYITSQSQLDEFIAHARTCNILAVDTEFLREKSYWPKLCLIQLGTEDRFVAVDPFKVRNLSGLAELMDDPNIIKLFHAATQDIEIIYNELGVIPQPIFDTQVAASLLGDVLQIGYGALVMNECGVKLKKADSYTDWGRRPLTDSQIDYALDDVVYLPQIYQSLKSKLEKLDRLSWLDADFAELSNPARYETHPETRYQRLKRVNQLTSRQLSAARNIASWREKIAMKRNVPRKWVITDEQIVEICKREPRTLDDLFMVRGVANVLNMADARHVLQLCVNGLDAPSDTWPQLPKPPKGEPNVDAQVDMLHALVKLRARQNGIAFAVLASSGELTKIARGHYEDCEILKGWRRRIVGEELLALMNGEISLSIHNGRMKVTNASQK